MACWLVQFDKKKMNDNIKEHLLAECREEGYDENDEGTQDLLRDSETISDELVERHRHWDDYRYVVEIDGKLIQYVDGYATGDEPASELGYVFDMDTIFEVKAVKKTVVTYEPVE